MSFYEGEYLLEITRDYLSHHQNYCDFWLLVEEGLWKAPLGEQWWKKSEGWYLFICLSPWKAGLGQPMSCDWRSLSFQVQATDSSPSFLQA